MAIRIGAWVPVGLVILFASAIAGVGMAISYSNQVDVMGMPILGFSQWKAISWPVVSDIGSVAVILGLATGMIRRGWPTWAAWGIFVLCSAVMLGVNGLSGGTVAWTWPPSWLFAGVAFAHSWPSLLGMAVLFLAIHGRVDWRAEAARKLEAQRLLVEQEQALAEQMAKPSQVQVDPPSHEPPSREADTPSRGREFKGDAKGRVKTDDGRPSHADIKALLQTLEPDPSQGIPSQRASAKAVSKQWKVSHSTGVRWVKDVLPLMEPAPSLSNGNHAGGES